MKKLKNMKIINNYNYSFEGSKELNTGEILTVPDMNLTMREIVDRYARGIPIPSTRFGEYDEGDGFDVNPSNSIKDLTDVDDIKDEIKMLMAEAEQKPKKGKVSEGEKSPKDITAGLKSEAEGGTTEAEHKKPAVD